MRYINVRLDMLGVATMLCFITGEGSGGIPLDKYVFNTEAHPLSIFPENWE